MQEHGHSPEEVRARIGAPQRVSYLRDTVYGAIDGAVTTFAIVAGVVGAGLSPRVIVALGIANVLADGFSMAAANYSGIKAEADNMRRLRAIEARHIDEVPEGERLELREILRAKGLTGTVLDAATALISSNKSKWIDLMLVDEYGLAPTQPHPLRAAMATFAAFLVAGLVSSGPIPLRIRRCLCSVHQRDRNCLLYDRYAEEPLVACSMVAFWCRDTRHRRRCRSDRVFCRIPVSRLRVSRIQGCGDQR